MPHFDFIMIPLLVVVIGMGAMGPATIRLLRFLVLVVGSLVVSFVGVSVMTGRHPTYLLEYGARRFALECNMLKKEPHASSCGHVIKLKDILKDLQKPKEPENLQEPEEIQNTEEPEKTQEPEPEDTQEPETQEPQDSEEIQKEDMFEELNSTSKIQTKEELNMN